jgi:hypothetical protein
VTAQPHGLSPAANVVKECGEEAGIAPDLAARAVPVGAVSYEALQPAGIKRDVLFCYDLRLPLDFVPAPQVFPFLIPPPCKTPPWVTWCVVLAE